jgi:hypothetical protein
MNKVNVLGTEYKILIKNENEDEKLKNYDGYCDSTINTIIVAELKYDLNTVANLEEYKSEVIRHELIHAFLDQSGLKCCSDWARNEEMVDFFAIQIPKIVKAMNELSII